MAETSLTPEEFELHLKDLRERLRAFLERGEGKLKELHSDAERVLPLTDDFPDVAERYPDVPGLVAEMLARETQHRYMAFGPRRESSGCLLGWLVRGRRKR